MEVKQRNIKAKTIEDVIEFNTGMDILDFLNTKKNYEIKNIDKACEIIKSAISAETPITIVGDYDVDGVCASAILKIAFKKLGITPKIRLPKRFSEGYGLSEKIVDEIDEGLLITVDNGIAAIDAIKKAKDKGLTVIVTDHHLGLESGEIPNADVVIDPNAIENTATFNGYCGAGIAYKLAEQLIPDDIELLKAKSLAGIATIADVMPLVEENRLIVKDMIKNVTKEEGRTRGLEALLEICGMDEYISEKNIAFKIAPILNAPGRLEDRGSMKSLQVLSYDGNKESARILASDLNSLNEKRKELKYNNLEISEEAIANDCLFGDFPLVIYDPNLHEGLIGIIAGNIAEKYRTPTIVFTSTDNEEVIKGSARSYGGVNIKELLDKNSSLLLKYGGHAEAAGLSIKKENLYEFRDALSSSIERPDEYDTSTIFYDLEIKSEEIENVLENVEKYGPYGEGNPEIVFYIRDFKLTPRASKFYRVMGGDEQHIKLFGKDADAVAFDMTKKYKALGEPKSVDIIGTLSRNYFNGVFTTQIEIVDFDKASVTHAKSPMALALEKMSKERYK